MLEAATCGSRLVKTTAESEGIVVVAMAVGSPVQPPLRLVSKSTTMPVGGCHGGLRKAALDQMRPIEEDCIGAPLLHKCFPRKVYFLPVLLNILLSIGPRLRIFGVVITLAAISHVIPQGAAFNSGENAVGAKCGTTPKTKR